MELFTIDIVEHNNRRFEINLILSLEKMMDYVTPLTLMEDLRKLYCESLRERFGDLGAFTTMKYTISPITFDPMTFEPMFGLQLEIGYTNEESSKTLGYDITVASNIRLSYLINDILQNNFKIKHSDLLNI